MTRVARWSLVLVWVGALAMWSGVWAQEKAEKPPDKVPVLSDVQRPTLQAAIAAYQRDQARLAAQQLALQLAQNEAEKSQAALAKLVTEYAVPGYDLNLDTLAYAKKPDPKK